jgi:hypothetical protein
MTLALIQCMSVAVPVVAHLLTNSTPSYHIGFELRSVKRAVLVAFVDSIEFGMEASWWRCVRCERNRKTSEQ